MIYNWWLLKCSENYGTLVRRKASQIEPRLRYQKELGQHCAERRRLMLNGPVIKYVQSKRLRGELAVFQEAFDGPVGLEPLSKKKKIGKN